MALLIERVSDSGFEFQLDGGDIIRDSEPTMTAFNEFCNFKTKNGANLYQRIDFTTVTILDTFGGTGSFTYTDIRLFWLKLTQLKFFDGLNSGTCGGSGVARFDELLDTLAYYSNNGKVPIVNEAANRLDYSVFYNVQNFTDLADCPSSLLANKLVTTNSLGTGLVFIDLPSDPQQYLNAFGWGVYQDETTQTTPLAYTTGLLQITNDGDGAKTKKTYFPFGVSDTFNVSTNEFDFSQFNIGDVVRLEVNLEVSTTVTNQNVTIDFKSAIGGALEENNRVYENELSSIGVLSVNFVTEILIKNSDVVSLPSQLLFSSNDNCDIVVNTFKTVCVRKDINYTEINATDNTANHYKGNYNASTNTPTLANGIGQIGDEYKVTVAGTQNFGAGAIAFLVGDYVGYDGFLWHKKINNNQSGGGGGGTSDLSLVANPTNNVVSNTNGTGFTIPAADGTNAGLFLPAEKVKVTAIDQAVSAAEKATWNGKQDALVSGTNIKTINGSSILGSGDLAVTGKRTHTLIFSHFTSAADFTNWYSKNRNPQTFGGITFVAYAGLTPTNDFANDTYQGHNHVLPFQCKVKSVFVKMRSNTSGSIPIDVAIQTVEFPNGSNDALSTSGINPKIVARETVTQLSSSQQPNVKFASGSLVTTHTIAEKSLCKLFWKNNFGASAGALEMSVIVEFEEV